MAQTIQTHKMPMFSIMTDHEADRRRQDNGGDEQCERLDHTS